MIMNGSNCHGCKRIYPPTVYRLWLAPVSHSRSFSLISILVLTFQHVHEGDEGDLKVGGDAEVTTGGEGDGVAV
jgi:hypothetical protein